MSLLDAVQAARGETTTSSPTVGTQTQPSGGVRLLDAVQVARGETTYQAPQPEVQKPSGLQRATTFIKQAAPVVVSELKNLDLKNIGKSVVAGAKMLPGQIQTAKGVLTSTWAQQNKAAIEFFGKHKAIEKALLNSPLKTPVAALKVAREVPGVRDAVKIGLAKTDERGAAMRDLGTRVMTAEKQKYQESAPQSAGLQRILELVGYNLPQMAASLAMSAAAGIATRNPAAATAVGLSTTFGFGASEVYNTAREYGISDSRALPLAQVGGTLIGLIDFLPLGRLLRKSGSAEVVKTGIIKRVANSVVSAGIQGGFESITENAQDIVSNAIRQTYDENQKLFDAAQFRDTTLVTLLTGGLADVTVGGVVSVLGEKTTDEQAIKEIEKRIDEAFTTPKESRTVEQQQVVDAMSSQEWTPDQALSFVLDNELNNTEVGRSITKAVVQARADEKNIKLVASEDTDGLRVELVSPEQPGQTEQPTADVEQAPAEQAASAEVETKQTPRETTSVPLADVDTGLIEMVEQRVNKKTPKILELEEAYKRGDKLPPIPVFEQNGRYVTNKDGFHRLQAQRNLGVENVEVVVEQKTDLPPEQKQAQERATAEMESQQQESETPKTPEDNPTLYHGTNKVFDNFDIGKSGNVQISDYGDGIYFTDKYVVAKGFAEKAGGDIVMERTAPGAKFANFDDVVNDSNFQQAMDDEMGFSSIAEYLKKKGFDGLKVPHKDQGGWNEYILYNTDKISNKSSLDPLIQEAKKYGSAEEFVKAQGIPVYRGGTDISKENITNAGISISKGRNVAEDFVKQKGGKVEEIVISPNAKIVDYSNIPNVKYKNLNDYSPELDNGNRQIWRDLEVEYQKAIDWAKLNGYDGVKLPLEGETRVINPDVLKTKSQLTDIYNQATKETEQKPKTPDEAISELNKYYSEADQEAVGNAWYEVMSEMEVAEAGQRIFNEDGEFVGGISSTFPDFVPEELRIKKLFDSVLKGISDPTNIQYPPNSQPRKQELYDIILMEIDSRAGTDSGELTIKIREAYDRAEQEKTRTKTEERPEETPGESPGRSETPEQPKPEVTQKPTPKKPGFSRFQERLEEQLLDSNGEKYNWDDTKRTYDKITLKGDAERAVKLLETDPERAMSIARGFEDPKPGDPTLFDIINAAALKAFDEGNAKLGTQLINKVSLTATRYGQNIVTLRGNFNNNTPQSFIKQVIDNRLEALGKLNITDVSKRLSGRKQTPKTKATAKIDVEVERLQKRVKSEMKLKQNKIQLAQSIIDSLKCK